MTPSDARRILQFHRSGTPEADSPEVAESLALVRRDPELRAWFEEQQQWEERLRAGLRSIAPPPGLRERLLARPSPVIVPWFQQPALLAWAAAVALLAVAGLWWLRPAAPDRFVDFRQRMVSAVLRSYHMDLESNDGQQLREFLARASSPADFEIPEGLAKLELAGGGRLQWRGHPVSMVCFERGDDQMLFLFVIRGSALADAPSAMTRVTQVNKLATVSWSRGENLYLLAGPPEAGFAQRVL
jgi:hypothetical protein